MTSGLLLMIAGVAGTGPDASAAQQRAGWALVVLTAAWHVYGLGWATGVFRALWVLCLAGMIVVAFATWAPRTTGLVPRVGFAAAAVLLAWVGAP